MGFLSILGWLNPKRILMLGAAIILMVGLWKAAAFINEKYELEKEVFRQEVVIQQQEIRIDALIVERDLAQEAVIVAEETLDAERARAIALEAARQRARSVAPEDNGAVAPVLLDALDVIRQRGEQ